MALWQTSLVTMVRYLVNDVSLPYTWDETYLQNTIVIAGLLVAQEYPFAISYSFDLAAPDIIPDPVSNGDNEAIALFSLKAGCMLETNRYQNALATGGVGVTVRDGDSMVSTEQRIKSFQDILDRGPCAAYQAILKQLSTKRAMGSGKAIGTPLTHWNSVSHSRGTARAFFDDYLRMM